LSGSDYALLIAQKILLHGQALLANRN